MTDEQKKAFKPTASMIAAAYAVFEAMATISLVRPLVLTYQRKVLQEGQWYASSEFEDMGSSPRSITEPEEVFLLGEADLQKYVELCNAESLKVGLKASSPERCPLLESEEAVRQAEQLLMQEMQHITGIKPGDLLQVSLGAQKKYIDLTLRLLAPFVQSPKERVET
jgi:hypothetical protein